MRAVIPIAVVLLVACVLAPPYAPQMMRYAAQMMMSPPSAAVAAPHPDPAPAQSNNASRSVVITPSRGGHFRVTARVDGRRIDFLIDTGASAIALKPEDAAMLGFRPTASDYVAAVKTANGVIRVAPVELGTVEIEDLEVHNVAAMVLPAGVLPENLLGLSFLRHVRFEFSGDKLVLEQ